MKLITTLTLLSLSVFPATAQNALLEKAADGEVKFGLEGLTTWRSEYIYRGFSLANQSLGFQLAGQVSLSNSSTLDIGFNHDTASGDGEFSETGAYIDFSKDIGDLTYTASLNLRDYSNSEFDSGADIGGKVNWAYNDTFDFTAQLSYDTGASGIYGELKASAYKNISIDSYLLFNTGLGITSSYYDRTGLHQFFAKLEYVYNINDSVSISPYIGTSLGIHDEAIDSIYSGVYFAVSF